MDSEKGIPPLSERIKRVREEKGWRNSEIARYAGTTRGAVTCWLIDAVKVLSTEVALRLGDASGFNPRWLATGRGPAKSGDGSALPDQDPALESGMRMRVKRIPLITFRQARMIRRLADLAELSRIRWILSDQKLTEKAFALEIEDDSMEPFFSEGDLIIADGSVHPEPGDGVVAETRSDAVFRRYRLCENDDGNRVVFELVPLNSDWPLMRSDRQELIILGTMIESRRYRKRKKVR